MTQLPSQKYKNKKKNQGNPAPSKINPIVMASNANELDGIPEKELKIRIINIFK